MFKTKFENYSKSVRPVNKWDDVLKVDINVKLKKIATVVIKYAKIFVDFIICINFISFHKIHRLKITRQSVFM